MKLTTQVAIVIGVGIVSISGLVLGLAVLADWSDGAVIGLATGLGGIVVNLVVVVRGQAKTAEVLQGQDDKLAKIDHQTNGQSDVERQDIAERAVTAAIAQLKDEGHL